MLSDIGNISQALTTLVAIVGIPLAVRQFTAQTRISQLSVLESLEERWNHRTQNASQALQSLGANSKRLLHANTLSAVRNRLSSSGLSPAMELGDVGDPVPRLVLAISPALREPIAGEFGKVGPRNEREYKKILLWRCEVMFPLLDYLFGEEDDAINADIAVLDAVSMGLATTLNDIAELFEFGIARADHFMQKRALQLIREIHVIEPMLIWLAARTTDDHRSLRVLRVLALGEAARIYFWQNPFHHRGNVFLRSTLRERLLGRQTYGPIITVEERTTWLPRWLQDGITFWRINRPLRDRQKRNQNRLIDEVSLLSRS